MIKFFKHRRTRLRFIARMRLKLKMMLSLDVSPKTLAKASAMGALIGISPYVGTHTYLALFFSSFLNLPVYPLMIGAYITNPVTIPFIYAFTTKVGLIVLGMDDSFSFDWSNITLSSLFEAGKTLLLPFIIGTHLCGIICAVIAYFSTYFIAKRYKAYKGVDESGNKKYGVK
ncbi:MAG: DUF2062 domain-containing protein [Mucispirillum sp.]|nr:DUF2062 domain-containing protein [Mucispirillum sp.]